MNDHRDTSLDRLLIRVVQGNRLFTVIEPNPMAVTGSWHVELVTSTHIADGGAHVAAAWIGNSVAVAVKHYLQITDEHFEKAVQQFAALCRTESQEQHGIATESTFCDSARRFAKHCEKVKEGAMGNTGLELYPYSPKNTRILDQAAQNAAHLLPHQGSAMAICLT